MTDKQLKKLKKVELLELMLTQSREIDRLKEELEETKKQLASKQLLIGNCGSIAEAALAINHVFEDAQKAADLYLENVMNLTKEQTEQASEEE